MPSSGRTSKRLLRLVVVVDHIDDLLLHNPLVPESWGPKQGTHVHKPVFAHGDVEARSRVPEYLSQTFAYLPGPVTPDSSGDPILAHPVVGALLNVCPRGILPFPWRALSGWWGRRGGWNPHRLW